ncbi:MAG: ferredoxin [Patescibacteria group bacterium]
MPDVKRENNQDIGLRKEGKYKKVIIDRDACIGAASCVAVAPGTFQLDAENKAYLVDPDKYDDDMLFLAAQSCPVNAISVFDENGKKIWPLDQ